MLESLILSAASLLGGTTGISFNETLPPLANLVAIAGISDETDQLVAFSPFDDDTFDDPETGLAPYVKQPKYISRAEWGADESLRIISSKTKKFQKWFKTEEDIIDRNLRPEVIATTNKKGNPLFWPLARNKKVSKFVIHHTGEYVNHTRDPMEIMRAIYRFHTQNRGWGDIGYNYVIDWDGNIYEGRAGGADIVGAHVAYHNIGTVGIALMGNFEYEEPTPRQLQVLKLLLADHAKRFNVDLNAKSYHLGTLSYNVSGHQDVARKGHGTACPGKNLIKHFPGIREQSAYLTDILYRQKKSDSKMARDFLSLSKDAPDVLKKEAVSFQRPKKEPLIRFTNIMKKKVIQRGDRKSFNIAFTNGTKDIWMPKSAIMITNIPEGMIVTDFRLTETVKPGDKGLFRGRIIVDKTANGIYELEMVPTFLRDKIFHGDQLPTLKLSLQVSGDKKQKRSANKVYQVIKKETPNYLKKLSASMFHASAPKDETAFVKVKLAFFEENYADIVGTMPVDIIGENYVLATIPAHTQIKIISQLNKAKNKRFIEVQSGENTWNVSGIKLKTSGILEVRNYDRGLSKRNAYNSFRGQINGHMSGTKLVLVNELPIEEYLWGLAEEPTTEPDAKKHAIHVLARSYAHVYSGVRRKFKTDLYDLEDDPKSSQFYLGYDWEKYHVEQVDLIKQTEGKVLTYNGQAVIGPYFTQSAGQSSDKWSHAYPWTYSRPLPFDEGLEQRGHGVGLSGNSARELAKEGKNYEEIIDYFFKDIEVEKVY